MTMFTLTVLDERAATLVAGRRKLCKRAARPAPISRNQVVLGKWAGRLGLGLRK